jgi:CspA family cold shock protein
MGVVSTDGTSEVKSMSEQTTIVECKRCGTSFILSPTYCDWLARRGVKVIQPMLCATCFSKVGPLPKQRGVIKWFNPHKHYGFIDAEEGEDVFFHQEQIVEGGKEAHEGQRARFHVRYAERGPQALNVEVLGE